MRYLSFTIKGFKPLQYGGIDKLQIDSFETINILTGENGKGKSSLLRELTPYPATRTDYNKDGFKQLVFEHDGHIGIVTSDFSKREGPHSFQWDGVELNVSGTTEVQIDQIETQCKHDRLVEKLMSGGCKFSMMSRNERRQLLMSTYPGSLEFVLDKHRNLMTQIRSITSQLKLLKAREVELKSKLQDPSIRQANQELTQLLGEACHAIDMDLYHYEQQLKTYNVTSNNAIQVTDYVDAAKRVKTLFQHLVAAGYASDSTTTLTEQLVMADATLDWLKRSIEQLVARGNDLKERLESNQSSISVDPKQTLAQLQSELEGQQEILTVTKLIPNVPVLAETPLDLEHRLEVAESASHVIRNYLSEQGQLPELEVANEWQTKINQLEFKQAELQQQQTKVLQKHQTLVERLAKYEQYSYPDTCVTICSLREAVANIVNQLRHETQSTQQELDTLNDNLATVNTELVSLTTKNQDYKAIKPVLQQLEYLFTNYEWSTYILEQQSLVSAINQIGLVELFNRAKRVIKNTYQDLTIRQTKERIEFLMLKLDAIKHTSIPSRRRLEELIQQEQSELERLQVQWHQLQQQQKAVSQRKEQLQQHQNLVNEIETIHANLLTAGKQLVDHKVSEFLKEIIDDLKAKKLALTQQLGALELAVKEQTSLATRLNDEILPTQQQLVRQLTRLEAVEKELSPTSGLPKRFMMNYINKVLERANAFIAQIWNYGMELVYLKPDEDCDYTFPVLINHDGRVKDISICSKGQKEIIDLALILAISTCRGYASLYPLKLDEMSSGLSPDHNLKLFGFLGELFSRKEINQSFIVSHDPIVSDGFEAAGYIALSSDKLPELCRIIVKLN